MSEIDNIINGILISEASTKIETSQINSFKKSIKKELGITSFADNPFYIKTPDGKSEGPFNKISQVSIKSKTCKGDMKIYNSKDKEVHPIFVSLKDYAFRQFGGSEDMNGGKIYKNTAIEAAEKILQNPFIKSKYNLVKKIFKKLEKDKFDFKYLKKKIKGFKVPMFSFEIKDEGKKDFDRCKFGFEFGNKAEISENNVNAVIIGKFATKKVAENTVEIFLDDQDEKSAIEWNPIEYTSNAKNKTNERYNPYLCFLYDERNHRFNEFTNCRFAIWPAYKVQGWIHEEDINEFLRSK